MDRGEGLNHAIVDVYFLLQSLEGISFDAARLQEAIQQYESEIRSRGKKACFMCRDACFEVHKWHTLGDHSTVRQRTRL